MPVQVQFLSEAFVHLAVAVAPTFRHVIDANVGETARTARAVIERMIMFTVELGSVDGVRKRSSNQCLKYQIHI